MAQAQPHVTARILVFRPRITVCASLTIRDRLHIAEWHETARGYGYDRLVIHERQAGDPPEVGSFLSIYKSGEQWSRWGITRMGDNIVAWRSASGANVGRFAAVDQALLALLPEKAPCQPTTSAAPFRRVRPASITRLRVG